MYSKIDPLNVGRIFNDLNLWIESTTNPGQYQEDYCSLTTSNWQLLIIALIFIVFNFFSWLPSRMDIRGLKKCFNVYTCFHDVRHMYILLPFKQQTENC